VKTKENEKIRNESSLQDSERSINTHIRPATCPPPPPSEVSDYIALYADYNNNKYNYKHFITIQIITK